MPNMMQGVDMMEMMPRMMMGMMSGDEGGAGMMEMMSKMPQMMTEMMPQMMTKMMPHCLSMMLPKMPKEERIDFEMNIVSTLMEHGCVDLSNEEKKSFMDKIVVKTQENYQTAH